MNLYMNQTEDFRTVRYDTTLLCSKNTWMLIVATFQVNGNNYNYTTVSISKFDSTILPTSREGPFFNTWDESAPYRTFTIKVNGILIPEYPDSIKPLYMGKYDSVYVTTFGLIKGLINHEDSSDPLLDLFLNNCTKFSQCGNAMCRGMSKLDCGNCALGYCNLLANGEKMNCITTDILECNDCKNSSHCLNCISPLSVYLIDRTTDSTTNNACLLSGIKSCVAYAKNSTSNVCKQCAVGYYYESGTNTCKQCQRYCAECDGGDIMDCIKCMSIEGVQPQYATEGMNCTCNAGHFGIDNECIACMSSCEYCISSSEYRCYDFDFIAKDDAVCRDDQYLNQTSDFPSCESCHIFCDGCSGPTYLNCVKCLDDTYPIKNTSDNCSCKENYTFSEYIEGFCEYTPKSLSLRLLPLSIILTLLLIL